MMHRATNAAIRAGDVREGVLDSAKSRFIAIHPYFSGARENGRRRTASLRAQL